jgi:uncharacterized LabA/DUF88 family protein
VTTQHIHDEQSDVEVFVAEQPYASEFVADSAPAEVSDSVSSATPEEATPSASFTAPIPAPGEEVQETPLVQPAHTVSVLPALEGKSSFDVFHEILPQEDQELETVKEMQIMHGEQEYLEVIPAQGSQSAPAEAEVAAVTSPAPAMEASPGTTGNEKAEGFEAEATAEINSLEEASPTNAGTATTEGIPPLEMVQEEVRPFTDFIEEFRQAEARLSASRQEIVSESFSLFEVTPTDPIAAFAPFSPGLEESTSPTAFHNREVVMSELHETVIEERETKEPERAAETTLAEQTPTTHEATEVASATPVEYDELSASGQQAVSIDAQAEEPTAAATQQLSQKTFQEQPAAPVLSEPEPPRPARRYRFDRPTVANGALPSPLPPSPLLLPTSNTPAPRLEEQKETRQSTNGTNGYDSTHAAEKQSAQPIAQTTQTTPVLQEVTSGESSTSTAAPSGEQERRRRHGQERTREKEQATPPTPIAASTLSQPVQEIVPPTTEQTPSMIEEIALEDLPPLEYAELQKTTGRRRRRHRSSTTAAAPTPTNNSAPLAEPSKPEAIASSGTSPITSPSSVPSVSNTNKPATPLHVPYSIVSGYTVNQMNQGGEVTGPFMAPEPSPARGSVLSRDGRTVRAEAQRTHVYPTRGPSTDNVSATSIQQLSNVLSQAIQTQTDRMVAELRRANQAPANVSVLIPPFPSTERVGVFVDVANLLYSARTMRISIDFGKLLDFLRGNRRLVRAHAYCPTSPQAGDEQTFLQAVKGLGYRITTKNYKTFASGAKKADLDLDLCMDVVRLVEGRAIDCVVLVSGDSDFMPMLDYCSDHGVRVEVAAFDEAMSATLRQSCDLFINLSMLEEIRS